MAGKVTASLPLGDVPQGYRSILIASQEKWAWAGGSLQEQHTVSNGSWGVVWDMEEAQLGSCS